MLLLLQLVWAVTIVEQMYPSDANVAIPCLLVTQCYHTPTMVYCNAIGEAHASTIIYGLVIAL